MNVSAGVLLHCVITSTHCVAALIIEIIATKQIDKKIEWHKIFIAVDMPSSVIRSYHYDNKKRNLIITFVSGIKYIYKKVPPTVFDTFKQAVSKGIFFNRHIKPNYEFEKLETEA